jgi:cytochrome P450
MDLKAVEGTKSEYQQASRAIFYLLALLERFPSMIRSYLPQFGTLKKYCVVLENLHLDILKKRVKEKKENPQQKIYGDMLDALLEEINPNNNQSFSYEEIICDLQDILIAGHETTSYALTLVFYHLSLQPEWQERVRGECDQFGSFVSYEDATPAEMPPLKKRSESLRSLPFSRKPPTK